MAFKAMQEIEVGFSNLVPSQPGSRPQNLSRYFGGESRKSHPYVNGYWQFLLSPPEALFGTKINVQAMDLTGDGIAAEWFHATAEAFTPPSRTLSKADVPAQGGIGSSWVTGQQLTRTFSITHREYRDLPILKLYRIWTNIIVSQLGVSEVPGVHWDGDAYKGQAMVILTKPTGHQTNKDLIIQPEDIEEVYYFDGVWPENEPVDTFNQDIASNDVVQHNINFSFDGWPLFASNNAKGTTSKIDTTSLITLAAKQLSSWQYQHTYDIYTKDVNTFNKSASPFDTLHQSVPTITPGS